jgi:MATE family multidrug resistance protein
MAMPTTDILMLGVLGQEALAAAALATTAYVFLWLIGLGPASAVAPVIAQIVGANPSDRARVRVALRMGFWSVLMLCVPIGIGLFFAEEALLALGQAPELARLAGPYVQVLSLGLPFSFGFNVLRNFSTALGRPRPPLAIMCAGVLLNIVLDYALIFGRFGMPEMGMIGAAFSTALVTAFCFSRWRAL